MESVLASMAKLADTSGINEKQSAEQTAASDTRAKVTPNPNKLEFIPPITAETEHQKLQESTRLSKEQNLETAKAAEILSKPAAKDLMAELATNHESNLEEETVAIINEILEKRAGIAPEDKVPADLEPRDLPVILAEIEKPKEIEENLSNEFVSYLIDYQTEIFAEPKVELTVQPAEITVPIVEVEAAIQQLAEKIQVLEPKQAQITSEILDLIVELPTQLTLDDEGGIINEVEVREELEELFIILFDHLQIDHTPELIESFMNLTLNQQLTTETIKTKEGKAAGSTAKEYGTHEAVKRLLTGLNNIKRAISHAYLIGKSALRLYASEYSTAT